MKKEDTVMHQNTAVNITTRDKLLRAWQQSTELTRDFEVYSREIRDNDSAAMMFSTFAEEEAKHAAKLLGMLRFYEN